MKILLVTSAGGHLAHLMWLAPWWRNHERVWVCEALPEAWSRLEGERVLAGYGPTNRNIKNLLKNTGLALRVFAQERPDLVVSTGAGLAIPFLFLAPFWGARSVFIEVYDRIEVPSLTGRLVARWVDAVVLQWPSQRKAYPHGVVLGPIR